MVRTTFYWAILTELTELVLGELPITKLRFAGPTDCWRFKEPDSQGARLMLEMLSRRSYDQPSQTKMPT